MSDEKMPSGWRSFHRRLILSINGLFLATMVVFLTASYLGERSRHFRDTFAHLDETLGVVAELARVDDSRAQLVRLENQLAERTNVPHRLFVVRPDGTTESAGASGTVGKRLTDAFELTVFADEQEGWYVAIDNEGGWIVSSTDLADPDDRTIYLMRKSPVEWIFTRRFLAFHGLHVLLTILFFTALLEVAGSRWIRKPIKELTTHIETLESGRFKTWLEPKRDDEFGWLATRFTQMAERLQELVTRRVRTEKYASAHALAWRVGKEMQPPLQRLNRDLLFLESSLAGDTQLEALVTSLRKDHGLLVASVQDLQEIEPPVEEEPNGGGGEGVDSDD